MTGLIPIASSSIARRSFNERDAAAFADFRRTRPPADASRIAKERATARGVALGSHEIAQTSRLESRRPFLFVLTSNETVA